MAYNMGSYHRPPMLVVFDLIMKPNIIITILCVVLLAGCFQIGPAYPVRDGRAYLSSNGYTEGDIELIAELKEMPPTLAEKAAQEASTDVRFLIAQNPHISKGLLLKLSKDQSDFVRGGVANNLAITTDLIKTLRDDPSHTTRLYLSRNPSVPEEDLWYLHKVKKMELMWFAMNPKCPQGMQDLIHEKGDDRAKYWLKVMQEHIKNGNLADGPAAADL